MMASFFNVFRARCCWRSVLALACLSLAACGDSRDTGSAAGAAPALISPARPAQSAAVDPALQTAILEVTRSYLDQIERDYQILEARAGALLDTVDELLAVPDSGSLDAARQAWLDAHDAYQATLLHQHFAAQVLSQARVLRLNALAYELNHWPILPGYVDSVTNYPESGLVHDVNVSLDEATLREVHGQFDLAEAALGFHVLEFLLWGDNPDDPRQAEAFLTATDNTAGLTDTGLTVEQLPANRRRALLGLLTRLLLGDIQASRELTVQGLTGYFQDLDRMSPGLVLEQLLLALGSLLNEEFLVRSLYPLLNGDYASSIQSPYSEATENTVVAQLASVEHLLLETRSSEGRSLDGILSELSPEFAELFYPNFDASKECLVSLYAELEEPTNEQATLAAEFSIVECINLLNNMIDRFQQIQVALRVP